MSKPFLLIEEPIHAEIFSIEKLKQLAESLAQTQTITSNPKKGYNLSKRLKENEKILDDNYHAINEAVNQKQTITSAAEWLIDNFHVVKEQLKDIQEHLPIWFYKELPKLADGPHKGYPRVYGIARAFVAHTDSHFDLDTLIAFVRSYQTVQPLTIGELWAIATTLRIVLVENLRRLSIIIVSSAEARKSADKLADELLSMTNNNAIGLEKLFVGEELRKPFLVQMIQRLRYQDPLATPALQWLNEKLIETNSTPDELVSQEHNRQSSANLTVRNIITSMRLISACDWRNFFESVSLVNETLDVNPIFASIDFITKDHYLHAIEELAKGSKYTEIDIAKLLISKIDAYKQQTIIEERKTDPGYYLISSGRTALDKELNFKPKFNKRLRDFYIHNAKIGYFSGIIILTFVLISISFIINSYSGLAVTWVITFTLLSFFPSSDIVIAFLNKMASIIIGPQHLALIKLPDGVPKSMSTFVVMPILLINEQYIEEHIEQLEVHYLSNTEGQVHFALLSDWKDSASESNTDDSKLLKLATEGIEKLNNKYGNLPDGGNRFFIFHRKRLLNPSENKWMGWERKRGKLHEFNRLLRGATDTSYINASNIPEGIKYVITLDSDTRMPINLVKKLVGTIVHPLNKARLDPVSKRVIEGYGILQPRVIAALPSRTNSSIFQRLFSGPCGIDPYTFTSSDIYQDLFGEGTYTGKGIYDVDIFETALENRVPVNSLLSHDLFEGTFARCGFVSDLDLFEDFPSHTEIAASRSDRWTRGDWQLLPWIFGAKGKDIPLVSRWKMLDNLRRSLSPIAMVISLVLAWFVPHSPYVYWTAFILLAITLPLFIPFISNLLAYPQNKRLNRTRVDLNFELALSTQQALCILALLLSNALHTLSAIANTFYRLLISKRNLLEWVSVSEEKVKANLSFKSFLYKHRKTVILASFLALCMLCRDDSSIQLLAAPFIISWILSPFIARYISLPPETDPIESLGAEEIKTFRLIARRTWKFFTSFVTEEDNFLPPDNFQETPQPIIAHRSSPTNFGLYLLSVITAHDFGWIGLSEMANKLDSTMKTLTELPRYQGHFYNWYDLQTKQPLNPRYISSVDSGNLAGFLLVLSQTCKDLPQLPYSITNQIKGIQDNLILFKEAVKVIKIKKKRSLIANLEELENNIQQLEKLLKDIPALPSANISKWLSIQQTTNTIADISQTFAQEYQKSTGNEVLYWAKQINENVESLVKDYLATFAWVKFFDKTITTNLSKETKHQLHLLNDEKLLGSSLIDLCKHYKRFIEILEQSNEANQLQEMISDLKDSRLACEALREKLLEIANSAKTLFKEMDFQFLFNPTRKLFYIGYNVTDNCYDASYYDMLASEARLTSFIAIAKGDIPVTHWFSMSRVLTPIGTDAALLSWSGSMFEYLMPSLIMYTPRDSLLDKTCRLVITRQIQYGDEQKVPWGISESAYNVRDLNYTYQYSSFGVPGLGLKRGIAQDLVISPYTTALAAMYYPKLALENFKKLETISMLGDYGFYEAVDYTNTRVPENQDYAIVQNFMAHHQGMSLVALANVAFKGIMRHRFHSIPEIKAAELLLQERTPHTVAVVQPKTNYRENDVRDVIQPDLRRFGLPDLNIPSTHFLSNGRYTVMLSSAGSGYSRCNDVAITRWREDATCDMWGTYIFFYDTNTKQSWSMGYQPSAVKPNYYEVNFTEDRARIYREDGDISSNLDLVVSAEDDAEIRRISIKNTGLKAREIEVTSYSEIVLAPQNADLMHPAFSNLFVETEYLANISTIIATRRPRSAKETPVWMAHVIALEGNSNGNIEYETDRSAFLGRGRSIREAVSITEGQSLCSTVGAVLDPIMSLRTSIQILPGSTRHIYFSTIVANSREEVINLADKYHDIAMFERATALVWTYSQAQLHYLGIDYNEANLFQQLANNILYVNPLIRPANAVLKRNTLNVTGLWAHHISGDNPILLVHIDSLDDQTLIKQLLRAHEYWRLKRFAVDLVIINEKTSYIQDLQLLLETIVSTSLRTLESETHTSLGSIFVLRGDQLNATEKDLLETVARVVIHSKEGNLTKQTSRLQGSASKLTHENKQHLHLYNQPQVNWTLYHPPLEFFNGLGGFANEGRDYVIVLNKLRSTPAPWINIIANDQLGFLVSESGSGYTWSLNSRENQLTPWSNDPVVDPSGEIFYITDEETQESWTPTALPIREEDTTYITTHGQGYSNFEHFSHGIETKLTQYVSYTDPIKISRLRLKNRSNKSRKLSITAYIEWVLGASRSANAQFIISEVDPETNALFVYNPWNRDFGKRIAFADFAGKQNSWTADRTEFIGRNGNLKHPSALMNSKPLSGKAGAGLDPCSVQKQRIELAAGKEIEVVFFLGQTENRELARELIQKYRSSNLNTILDEVKTQWDKTLGKIQIKTPDRENDILINRWLMYQTLVCRYWARTAFYQAGGAYGFRDQLQDVMALIYSHPDITRTQILNAARHQFLEGDVQHWWHPPSDKGVRTKCSDDSIWLAYVTHYYISITGDSSILNEELPFLEGRALLAEEESAYYEPTHSNQSASLYEHCKRVLDRSLKVGAHGLPFIGSCDWNDGMNMVGHKGLGESVWLGWFLYKTLIDFSSIATNEDANRWLEHAQQLQKSLESEAWDGAWYKRAFYDDGTPLGSASNTECRIDSIAQSWSVISQAADKERATKAMQAVEKHLIKPGDNLILLFTPPFDKTTLDPGYIKGYLPGIRENGSQYTHAGVWAVIAFAMLNNGNKAQEYFNMLNPINHTSTRAGVHKYKVEPYVIAADIYSEPSHFGRGGWTWYTGSAGWMYRACIESILGLNLKENFLEINPCVPDYWHNFTIYYQHGSSNYEIQIERRNIDAQPASQQGINLVDDGKNHIIKVVI